MRHNFQAQRKISPANIYSFNFGVGYSLTFFKMDSTIGIVSDNPKNSSIDKKKQKTPHQEISKKPLDKKIK